MRFEISQKARRDIFAIQDHSIAQFGILQTDLFLDGLTALLKLIAQTPLIAHERREFSQPVRLQPYKSLVIAYRIEKKTVKIMRVLHGRQDLQAHL